MSVPARDALKKTGEASEDALAMFYFGCLVLATAVKDREKIATAQEWLAEHGWNVKRCRPRRGKA
jgi:hypothetical protein